MHILHLIFRPSLISSHLQAYFICWYFSCAPRIAVYQTIIHCHWWGWNCMVKIKKIKRRISLYSLCSLRFMFWQLISTKGQMWETHTASKRIDCTSGNNVGSKPKIAMTWKFTNKKMCSSMCSVKHEIILFRGPTTTHSGMLELEPISTI